MFRASQSSSRPSQPLPSGTLLLLLCALAGSACSDDSDPAAASDAGAEPAGDASMPVGVGACKATVQRHAHDSKPASHVAQPLPSSTYNSRPPSSGPHCPSWGQYRTYDARAPLPACNFLHNLEHGAVALLYRCPDGCPEIVRSLQALIDGIEPDPDCGDLGVDRLVLTPYADMDTQVAAAAWGYTFTAECLDDDALEVLEAFILEHWGTRGDAPEALLCADG